MKTIITAILSLTMLTAACEDPAADKPKAETTNPSTSQTGNSAESKAVPSDAKGEQLSIAPANSTVTFVGSKVTGGHNGGFTMFTGTIDLVNSNPEESKVTVEIDANTVFSDDPKLTDHLKSKDFFDVAKFPKASFTSTKIEPSDGTAGNYNVTGDLDLHGVVKSVRFPARITVTDGDVTVQAAFRINRKDFGIVYAGQADNLIRDDVGIALDVKAPRKS